MTRIIIFLPALLLCACGTKTDCYQNLFQNITNYGVEPNAKTPSGIRVDTGGYPINLQKLDKRIALIESCIQTIAESHPLADADWQCLKTEFRQQDKLKRDCLIIKIVPSVYSKCSNWQFIDAKAPDKLCVAKGLVSAKECPCQWRTAIQDENIIITPPEETRNTPPTVPATPYLWEIGRLMTSCNNVWASPFSQCLSY